MVDLSPQLQRLLFPLFYDIKSESLINKAEI